MAKKYVGALIVIERGVPLKDIMDTGEEIIDAVETRLVSAADAGLRGDVHCAVVQGIVDRKSVV